MVNMTRRSFLAAMPALVAAIRHLPDLASREVVMAQVDQVIAQPDLLGSQLFRFTFPDGTVFECSGVVTALQRSAPLDGQLELTAHIAPSGSFTITNEGPPEPEPTVVPSDPDPTVGNFPRTYLSIQQPDASWVEVADIQEITPPTHQTDRPSGLRPSGLRPRGAFSVTMNMQNNDAVFEEFINIMQNQPTKE